MSEEVRSVLDRLVEELKPQEAISSIGLFGSWSRGDAVESSDVDLLILDSRDFDNEYVERIQFDELLLDLNYVPEKLLRGRIPPELDQKIYEAEVLYDRDQHLTRTKSWMMKTYRTQERVDLRTESYLVDAYTYLSRATSAENKGDLRSATVYGAIGLEEMLKILIEIGKFPVSNSHFIEALKSSAEELSMQETFRDYLDVSRLSGLDRGKVGDMLTDVEAAWNEAISSMQTLDPLLETLHVKVRTNLRYYGKPTFLKGFVSRSKAMIDENAFAEAGRYVTRTLVDMLENYAWLALTAKGYKLDYTTLFDSLGGLDSCKAVYEGAVKALRLGDVSAEEVEESLKRTRELIIDLRQRRRNLISRYVGSTD